MLVIACNVSVQAVFADDFDAEVFLNSLELNPRRCFGGGQIYGEGGVGCAQCPGGQSASNGIDECFANCKNAEFISLGDVCSGDPSCAASITVFIISKNLCQKCKAGDNKYYLENRCVSATDCNNNNMVANTVLEDDINVGVCEPCASDQCRSGNECKATDTNIHKHSTDGICVECSDNQCFNVDTNVCMDLDSTDIINNRMYRDTNGNCAACEGYTVPQIPRRANGPACVTQEQCKDGYGMLEVSGIDNARCGKCEKLSAVPEFPDVDPGEYTLTIYKKETGSDRYVFANHQCWATNPKKGGFAYKYMKPDGLGNWIAEDDVSKIGETKTGCVDPERPVWVVDGLYYDIYYWPEHFECGTCVNGIWEEDSAHAGGWKCTLCESGKIPFGACKTCADLNMNAGCSVDSTTGRLIGVPLGGYYFENDGSRSSAPLFCAKTAGDGTDMCWTGDNNNNTCTPCDLNNTVVSPRTATDGRPYNEKTNATCSEGYYINNGTCTVCLGAGKGWYKNVDGSGEHLFCDDAFENGFLAYKCVNDLINNYYRGNCDNAGGISYNKWIALNEENLKQVINATNVNVNSFMQQGKDLGYLDANDKTIKMCTLQNLGVDNNGLGADVWDGIGIGLQEIDGNSGTLLYIDRGCFKCKEGYGSTTDSDLPNLCKKCPSNQGPIFIGNGDNKYKRPTAAEENKGYYGCSPSCKFEGWGKYNNECVLCSDKGMQSIAGSEYNICQACPKGTGWNEGSKTCGDCPSDSPSYNGKCLDFTGLKKEICDPNGANCSSNNPFYIEAGQIKFRNDYQIDENGNIQYKGTGKDNPHRYEAAKSTDGKYYWVPCRGGSDNNLSYSCCYEGKRVRQTDNTRFVLPGMACTKDSRNNTKSTLLCDDVNPGFVRGESEYPDIDSSYNMENLTSFIVNRVCNKRVGISNLCDNNNCIVIPEWLKVESLSTKYLDYTGKSGMSNSSPTRPGKT